jgi:hypothetical protein
MKKLLFLPLFLFAAAIPLASHASSTLTLSAANLKQGDTLIVSLPASRIVATSTFAGGAVQFFPFRNAARAVIGIPPTMTPGAYRLHITFADGSIAWRTIRIQKRNFPVVDLGVPDTINETPDQVVQGFGDINTVLNGIVAVKTPAAFESAFQMPLAHFTRYGAPFGELRKTGSSTVRHLGTDFTAPAGTPVMAVNGGTVRFATSTDLYGNMIVLDHGAGIYSLYLHLSRMDVTPGQTVIKGQIIGAVGQTGYAFGPHLHLSLKINSVSVDPVRFIQSFK